ncbi:hypothetical protein OS493_036177 [Desmophyllum pertusum]|uniref:Neurochondrin n=1 Tax=Desmophyllum pertusum TaxID=174260 RepID=A0A9X0D2C2_9CNID|nr:hypothetical protein OS493_036177 [Desmophyllum pertusum]
MKDEGERCFVIDILQMIDSYSCVNMEKMRDLVFKVRLEGSSLFHIQLASFHNFIETMSATCGFSREGSDHPESSLQKCISVLKAAKSDNERFAALLLVTQLVQSNAVGIAGRRQLFEAVGFKFINRLLKTRNVPSDCPRDVYNSLALTILACFSTDEELCVHPEMIEKIPLFLAGINTAESETVNEVVVLDDIYQIIASLACTSTGCKHLVEKGAFSTLCRVIRENDGRFSTKALEILLRILNNGPRVYWPEQKDVLFEALSALSSRFKEAQNHTKFELCNHLVLFLSGAEKSVFQEEKDQAWLRDVYTGLNQILQSKISSEQRDPAIVLVSLIIELVGMEWMITFSGQETPGLFILSLTIASVEIRMILDEKNGRGDCDGHLPTMVNSRLSKVYSLATESIHSIVTFLDHVAPVHNNRTMTGIEGQVVFASVRVLCAWMAEETSALQDDICKLLPFLLKLGKESLNTSSGM